jgi:MutS domain V
MTNSPAVDCAQPHAEYSRRWEERKTRIAALERRHRSLGNFRLAAAIVAVLCVFLALAHVLSILWVALPVAAFTAMAVYHERLLERLERVRRAARYYERGLARLDGHWAGTSEQGGQRIDPEHPYAQDLDLFGKGSVFELLCTARTHIGEDTLARWLLAPAEPATVRARQEAVEELRSRLELREDLAVLAESARTGVDPVSLAAWGESQALLGPGKLRNVTIGLTGLGLAGGCCLAAYVLHEANLAPMTEAAATILRDVFLLALLVNGVFLFYVRNIVTAVVAAVNEAAHELGLLSGVLLRLERERFHSPLLAGLRASLDTELAPPSRRLHRLNRLMEYLDSRENAFVRTAEPFLLWTLHFSFAVESWRRHSGSAVRRWLTATGEMEALCSFASHAFEHPADPFPDFVPDTGNGGPVFEAEGIGHPLIPETRVVRNDVSIRDPLRVLVVSGSNMSGKSTLLRTLGVNAVLAQAGAPVRARRLTMSPLAVAASIRVLDSIQTGVSRFYAEILRLRLMLDMTGRPMPVLFLIDEFLHGTNSHDRRIGAEAVVRGLVERGAIGLITTHDLALAEIAGSLGERAANVHFEDRIEDGQIHFDYKMRPGVVRKSNALELMRSVGLEI